MMSIQEAGECYSALGTLFATDNPDIENIIIGYCIGRPTVHLMLTPAAGGSADCPVLSRPLDSEISFQAPNILSVFYVFPYSKDPVNCFDPHPLEIGWFDAGVTLVTLQTPATSTEAQSWIVYDHPAVREWDGRVIVIGDVIDLYRLGDQFLHSWTEYGADSNALYVEMHIQDLEGNSTVVGGAVGE
jgi:hypothetical protein